MTRKVDPHRRQRGAAAVEFALVLPIFLLLVMGAIDWGWFFFIDQVATNGAREGARAGSVVAPAPLKTISDAVSAAQTASEEFLKKMNFNEKGVVAASATKVDGTDAVKVVITYPAGSLTGLLSNIMPANVHATSVMRWQ
jgi:Flp pilus assembly protein TadG